MNPTTNRSTAWPRFLLPGLVFALALAVFAPSLWIGFRLDDDAQILNNAAVQSFDAEALLTRGYWENVRRDANVLGGGDLWRPLTSLSAALSWSLHGDRALGYHVENLLLHALCAALVVLFLRAGKFGELSAGVAGVLFAVAPIHIEPLGSVILRNELLAGAFGLGYLLLDLRGSRALAAIALLLALVSKESAIALLPLAVLSRRVFHGETLRTQLRSHLPAFVVLALYFAARWAVLGRIGISRETAYFGPEVPTAAVLTTMARFATEHLLPQLLFGHPLVFDYTYESFPTAAPDDAVGWLLLLAWGALGGTALFCAWRSRSRVGFALAAFALLYGPTSNLPTRIGVLAAGRLLYLPYLGIALLLALAARTIWERCTSASTRRALIVGGVALLLATVVQTERRLAVWVDPVAFYEDILSLAPNNFLAQGNLAEELLGRAELARATGQPVPPDSDARACEAYAASLRTKPENFHAHLRPLVRSAVLSGRENRLLETIDRAWRYLHPEAALPALPALSAPPEPLADEKILALRAWTDRASRVADPLPAVEWERLATAPPQAVISDPALVEAFASELALAAGRKYELGARLEALERALRTPAGAPQPALRALADAAWASAQDLDRLCRSAAGQVARSYPERVFLAFRNEAYLQAYATYATETLARLRGLRARIG